MPLWMILAAFCGIGVAALIAAGIAARKLGPFDVTGKGPRHKRNASADGPDGSG